ncbi:unnamed protein product [Wuchereria bancrofti]|uniref:Protein-serine/threonine phosphatase n=1 Tax=Wuchereria bancrofti TaxID=6293 RepID=A0A3P7EIN4_WUCBA|nr:unnamed protein product [Wuchereria bancrofti]
MLDENETTQKTEIEESRKVIKGKKSGKPPTVKEMNKSQFVKEISTEKKLVLRELIKKHLLAGSTRMEYELPDLHQLLTMAKASFQKVPTLVEVPCPVNICGDIHGQYDDLMRIFAVCLF